MKFKFINNDDIMKTGNSDGNILYKNRLHAIIILLDTTECFINNNIVKIIIIIE